MQNKLLNSPQWDIVKPGDFYASADDDTLIQLTVAGDKRAFEPLWSRYQKRIRARLLRFVNNPIDAEDLLQETFLKAYSGLPRFRGHSTIYTWLYRIATNIGINHASRGRLQTVSGDTEELNLPNSSTLGANTVAASPEQDYLGAQSYNTAKQAIDQLPSVLREAFALNTYQGFDYQSISELVDCPIGTVRSRISRARKAISAELIATAP